VRAVIRTSAAALAMWSGAGLAIPPALPGDAERMAEADRLRQETQVNLESPEAQTLIELFFERMGEGEVFPLEEIFAADAFYVEADGEPVRISEDLDDDGFPGIRQWQQIALFRLSGSWAAAASARSDQFYITETVLKFSFARDGSGALKISRIEEVRL
jgi:hypothetical protein